MTVFVIAGVLAVAFLGHLVIVAIGSHLEDRNASITQYPSNRLVRAVRRVTGLHAGNPTTTTDTDEKKEARV